LALGKLKRSSLERDASKSRHATLDTQIKQWDWRATGGRWYLQEPGREWGGRLEQRLRVVAAEQLDLPIPESNRREMGSEPEAEGSEAAAVFVTWWRRRGRVGRGRRRGGWRRPGRHSGRLAAG